MQAGHRHRHRRLGLGIFVSVCGIGGFPRGLTIISGFGWGNLAVKLEVGRVVHLAVRGKDADLLTVLHPVGPDKVLHKRNLSKRSRVCRRRSRTRKEETVGAYHARFLLASEVREAEAERLRPVAVGDILQPLAEVFSLDPPGADASRVSGARHVADAMHSALKGKDSGLEPGSGQISRQEPFSLQLGNPLHLVIHVNVPDSIFQPPLVLLSRTSDGELGQIEEIGPKVRRLNIKEGPLPVLARLDDIGSLVLRFAGGNQTAAGISHIQNLTGLAAFHSRRPCDPRLGVVSSEVEKPLP
jgi:hypothetical protein